MANGQYLYLSIATIEAIACKGRADLVAGYMVLAASRQGAVSGYTTAGAKAIGRQLGLGILERSEIVNELKTVPIEHTSGTGVTAVINTAKFNAVVGSNHPPRFASMHTLALPENNADSSAEHGFAWIPSTIVRGLNGRESPLCKLMALPRPERLPTILLMVRFFQHYKASLGAFDPRHTAWEEPNAIGDNSAVEYNDKETKGMFTHWVIPASSTQTAYEALINDIGGEKIFWKALGHLLSIGIIKRALVVCDADPNRYGDAEVSYTLYERSLSSGTCEGIYSTTQKFSDYDGHDFFGSCYDEPSEKGIDSFVVVIDSDEAMPIWLFRPVHDIGTEQQAAAKHKLESSQAKWESRIASAP